MEDTFVLNSTDNCPSAEIATEPIEPTIKRNLLLYLLVTAISFTVLVLPSMAGVSVPIFVIIQAGGLYYLSPQKKYLLVLIPIFILALNSFISANPMWQVANLIIAAVLYSLMAVWNVYGISLKDTSPTLFVRLAQVFGRAFLRVQLPIKWGSEAKAESIPTLRRILLAIGISIPVVMFLIVMLSRADMIFDRAISHIFESLINLIQLNIIGRILLGIIVGLYLFGILYGILVRKNETSEKVEIKQIAGDAMIICVVLTSVLFVYTLFVAIQFRYLFAAPDSLPYGLTFVTYARRGFFELLFLSFVNIASILVAVWLTKMQQGRGAKIAKFLCLYLCAVTVILLVSSFYRMWLYSTDDGLTRMRLLVFGFLIFECIGLIFTFFYVMKPKFNIILVYCLIALSYYLMLNLVPIDRIIAREQINRYFATGQGGINYALSLSPDAAPEIVRLFASENPQIQENVHAYFGALEGRRGWRQWNISRSLGMQSYQQRMTMSQR